MSAYFTIYYFFLIYYLFHLEYLKNNPEALWFSSPVGQKVLWQRSAAFMQ